MNVSSMCFSNPLNKEIKSALECIVELYRHAGIFKNAKSLEKCFVFIKNSKVLILVNNTRGRSIFSTSFRK